MPGRRGVRGFRAPEDLREEVAGASRFLEGVDLEASMYLSDYYP